MIFSLFHEHTTTTATERYTANKHIQELKEEKASGGGLL
jgi:hypothetical protein